MGVLRCLFTDGMAWLAVAGDAAPGTVAYLTAQRAWLAWTCPR